MEPHYTARYFFGNHVLLLTILQIKTEFLFADIGRRSGSSDARNSMLKWHKDQATQTRNAYNCVLN